MARFSVILSIAVLVVIALYTNQVLAQNSVIAADETDNENNCTQPDASDCIGRASMAGCKANLCCSGLQYSAANDGTGTVETLVNGTCTCCTNGYCRTLAGSASNTPTDADAVEIDCKLPAL